MIFYLISIAYACNPLIEKINVYPTVNQTFIMPLNNIFLRNEPQLEYDQRIIQSQYKQLFRHFLIIWMQHNINSPIVDICDFQKGCYVAKVQYVGPKGHQQIFITEKYLITPPGYEWKIKQKQVKKRIVNKLNYQMEEFWPYFSTNQDRLEGWWSDDCPFEFSYEEFENVKQPSSTLFEQKIKSVDGQQYAQIKDQESQIIIQIYQIPDIYITQIEIDGPKSNHDQIRLTQQYLIYIRDQSMFYYNFKQHQGFSFAFQKAYYLSLCYSQNELYIIIESGFRRIKLYRIHENFEIKFVKEVNWYNNNYLYGSIELNQHKLGFLVKDFDKIHLISNQTLKQVCSFKKLKIDDTYNLLKSVNNSSQQVFKSESKSQNMVQSQISGFDSTEPIQVQCDNCHTFSSSLVYIENTKYTYIFAVLLILICLCWVPFVLKKFFMKISHVCPGCDRVVGQYDYMANKFDGLF